MFQKGGGGGAFSIQKFIWRVCTFKYGFLSTRFKEKKLQYDFEIDHLNLDMDLECSYVKQKV